MTFTGLRSSKQSFYERDRERGEGERRERERREREFVSDI